MTWPTIVALYELVHTACTLIAEEYLLSGSSRWRIWEHHTSFLAGINALMECRALKRRLGFFVSLCCQWFVQPALSSSVFPWWIPGQ